MKQALLAIASIAVFFLSGCGGGTTTTTTTGAPTTTTTAAKEKGQCTEYFGDITGLVTIIDRDVGLTDASSGYCANASPAVAAPCTYVHYGGGSDATCQSPGPPDGCHHYIKTTYSKCDVFQTLDLTGKVIARDDARFNAAGALVECAENVVAADSFTTCFGPPAAMPVSCVCPSTITTTTTAASPSTITTTTTAAKEKGQCTEYFGDITGLVTIIDRDVGLTDASSGYCAGASPAVAAPCTYVHYGGGSDATCQSPGPPDGCHHYIKTTYSKCDALQTLDLTGKVIAGDDARFNAAGALVACADNVVVADSSTTCFGPPAAMPVSCVCPSSIDLV